MSLARWCSLGFVVLALTTGTALGAGRGEPGPVFAARVEPVDGVEDVRLLRELDLDVDAVFDSWARVYLVEEERAKLETLGYRVVELPRASEEGRQRVTAPRRSGQGIPAAYHTYATLTSELQSIAAARPDLVVLSSAGQSVQGRELWLMKITRNPDVQEDEPELAYVSSMHGDEVVGQELCIELIHYLLDNYGTDPRVTTLIDSAEVWIMPSMNPDGTALGQRYNANGYDLNRSFPDWFDDPNNTPVGRQPEVQALMTWVAEHTINLSANFHGGALLVNYPWDNNETGSNVFSPTPDPDHPAFLSVSLTYAENNPPMHASTSFPDGVTNGAAWYVAVGGMQDWSYAWHGKFDVTIEVSEVKWPPANQLPGFWEDNRESMLAYLERGLEGLRGIVTDAVTGQPLAAAIRLGASFPVYTDPEVGDFHRVVLPGFHGIQVAAPGYEAQNQLVSVAAGPATRRDFALWPLPSDLQPVAAIVHDGPPGNGALDPDETADLELTLQNLGSGVTGVDARLISTGWFADVVRADADYPDLENQGTGSSVAPHFAVHVADDVPQGHRLGFAVRWEADQAQGVSEPIFLTVGDLGWFSEAAADVPQSILDNRTLTSEILVSSGQVVQEVRVPVAVTHTYIGDLSLTLRSPAGTAVVLHSRSGGSANDIVGTYGFDLTPAESLSAFAGEDADGVWTLEVTDHAGGDTGTLDAWGLHLRGGPVELTTPEMYLREFVKDAAGTRLRWWPYPGLTSYRVYRSIDPSEAAAFLDVTLEDDDPTDTSFLDRADEPLTFFLVTGVGPNGEGPKGHFGE